MLNDWFHAHRRASKSQMASVWATERIGDDTSSQPFKAASASAWAA
jgi:hypothetical protein